MSVTRFKMIKTYYDIETNIKTYQNQHVQNHSNFTDFTDFTVPSPLAHSISTRSAHQA